MILTIPFLRNLRLNYPDSQIDMLVSPNSGEVIEDCPYVNNFIYFDTTRKHRYENGCGKKKSFWHYVKLLRKEKYDKAYVLKRSLSSAVLCFFAGIKERVGFDTEGRGLLLTKRVKYDKDKHESLCFLDVLTEDGLKVNDTYLENWVNIENTKKAEKLLSENNTDPNCKIAVVNAQATNPAKVWDIKNFTQIIEYLSNEKNVQVVFIGAQSDKGLYDAINYNQILKIPPVNLCGQVNLKDSLAVLKIADFIIGNDSGTLHMASSVSTPVIGIYGPMPFEKWRALGDNNILLKADLDCIPCSLKSPCGKDHACLKLITVEKVKRAIDKILS